MFLIDDLKGTTGKLGMVGEFGISQLRATAIKPRVKPWVDTFTITSHDISEVSLEKGVEYYTINTLLLLSIVVILPIRSSKS